MLIRFRPVLVSRRPEFSGRSRPAVVLLLSLIAAVLASCTSTDGNNFQEPRFATTNGAIEGFVTSTEVNPAVALTNVLVYTEPVGGVARTGAGGFYRIEGVAAGTYRVRTTRDPGISISQITQVLPGQVSRVDLTFVLGPTNLERDLYFLTNTGPSGQIAMITANGIFDPAQFTIIRVASLGGRFQSLRSNPANPNELLVMCNFEHPSNPDVFDLYRVLIDGNIGQVTRLTNDNRLKDGADWSPDGQQIALSQDADNDTLREIWIFNRDGNNARRLVSDLDAPTGAQFDNRFPAWSAEGTSVAFSQRRVDVNAPFDTRDFDIVHTLVDGGPVIPVTEDAGFDDISPTWMDRDVSLWYSKIEATRRQIFSAPADDGGSPETRFSNGVVETHSAVQSEDRRLVAFVTNRDVDGTNADGSSEITIGEQRGVELVNVRHITRTSPGLPFDYDSPTWRKRR